MHMHTDGRTHCEHGHVHAHTSAHASGRGALHGTPQRIHAEREGEGGRERNVLFTIMSAQGSGLNAASETQAHGIRCRHCHGTDTSSFAGVCSHVLFHCRVTLWSFGEKQTIPIRHLYTSEEVFLSDTCSRRLDLS